jgi:triphosphoribosyl-dephospho-CoA synthase
VGAAATYEAIRVAAPGGMGNVKDQDVAAAPTVTLQAAMALAADRDLIARQYGNGFGEVFQVAAPALRESLAAGMDPEEAIVACQLRFLSAHPDTLIARQRGQELAAEASARAAEFLPRLGEPGWFQDGAATAEFDRWLRSRRANPGTTADFVAAALFVELERENPALTNFSVVQ